MKRVNDKMLIIDGEKFKALLESKTGKTIKELSLDNGYSDSFLRMVVKTGKASPSAVTLAKLYGIEPTEQEKPEPALLPYIEDPEKGKKQISFDDLLTISKAELKAIVKDSLLEILTGFNTKEAWATYDAISQTYTLSLRIHKEDSKK